jgi:hypothetical protein
LTPPRRSTAYALSLSPGSPGGVTVATPLNKDLPGTLGRVLRQDREAALAFYRRGVDLEVVQSAFVLALARRAFRTSDGDLEPIRCLSFFVPVVEELIQQPPLPEYLDYLRSKLVTAGLLRSA